MKVIVSALFEEIETMFAKENMSRIKNDVFEIYRSEFNGEEVIVGCCGIGKVNAASFTQFVISHFVVDEIISIGAAGALNQELNIGDVVVGQDFVYGDVDVRAFGYKFGQMAQMPEKYLGKDIDTSMFDKLSFNTKKGTIVTVDKFLDAYDQNFDLLETKDVVEMESTAIAHVCFKNNVPVTCFRAVSDNSFCSDNAAADYNVTKKIVADNLYNILKTYI